MKSSDDEIVTVLFTLDRLEEESAVLVNGQDQVIIPKRCLPKKAKEGATLNISISTDEADKKHREKRAKELLNEILKGE